MMEGSQPQTLIYITQGKLMSTTLRSQVLINSPKDQLLLLQTKRSKKKKKFQKQLDHRPSYIIIFKNEYLD